MSTKTRITPHRMLTADARGARSLWRAQTKPYSEMGARRAGGVRCCAVLDTSVSRVNMINCTTGNHDIDHQVTPVVSLIGYVDLIFFKQPRYID